MLLTTWWLLLLTTLFIATKLEAQLITASGQPAELNIRAAGKNSIRITLKPISYQPAFPNNPSIALQAMSAPAISLRTLNHSEKKKLGALYVEVSPDPLTVIVTNAKGLRVQTIVFNKDGTVSFDLDNEPVLGMGEGGPMPAGDWRTNTVEFDRRGRFHNMQPRWQSDMYGTRNPVPLLIGTKGWALFVASPWVKVDLTRKNHGDFIPNAIWDTIPPPQTEKNQQLNIGKGLPPLDKAVPGLFDLFVFDAHEPGLFMSEFAVITGPAVMPPKWALGYMQSHRTLIDAEQMIGIVDTFRQKKIPVDAVIYLGTGFAPRGWNKKQPSFEFNPSVFQNDPKQFLKSMHQRHVKVLLHMVPWDRDKLLTLHGTIPAATGQVLDAGHIQNYWMQHVPVIKAGADGFWPDEGDWFNLYERIKRHQMYYQGSLVTTPNVRPWSLHRNGYPGIAQWGGWVWSGDTESSWKTLEAQVAVGINYSLSIGPYWGSDIGGFYSSHELTGELYARWFQFAAFCGSFRSHGRTWRTRLPWGWGLPDMGPPEDREPPLQSEMNNPAIEPIARKYDELRYQLLPYTYTLAWEARKSGMPLMRAMWLHYPQDTQAVKMSSQYLWGENILVAPVFEKGATNRMVYLPAGLWYDWWTNTEFEGARTINSEVDLSIMPLFVKAGGIIPFDPVRQYTGEATSEPTTLRVYSGHDGEFTLYEDDGISQGYLKGEYVLIKIKWNDKNKKLTIEPVKAIKETAIKSWRFKVEVLPGGITKMVSYVGNAVEVLF